MTPGVAEVVTALGGWQAQVSPPLVVAIDGYGASGKTTLADAVSIAVDATVIHTDDYFTDGQPTDDQRPMAQYFGWEALRREALEPAIAWRRDVPDSGAGPALILVEGVSSAAPALADLIDRAVFVHTPEPVRLERLHRRIAEEDWDDDWLQAERVYFASRPPESFDLIVAGA